MKSPTVESAAARSDKPAVAARDRSRQSKNQQRSAPTDQPRPASSRGTLALALLGSLLSWLALPPVGWWPLAWLAPIPWVVLIRRRELAGRRPYAALWLAGFAFWLATLQWLRLPHPATSLGWFALSAYLAFYLPVFIGLSRQLVHELRWPVALAAPVVWTGLELAQSHLLTGINIATPGHSQYRWIELIQISDLCGGYGVSFVILLVAASLAQMLPLDGQRRGLWPVIPAVLLLAAVLGYGHWRIGAADPRPGIKVALIQGSIDTQMKADPGQIKKIHDQYLALSQQAVDDHADLDLIVWPETMFREPLWTLTPEASPPADADWTMADVHQRVDDLRMALGYFGDRFKVPMLLGMDTLVFGPGRMDRYNSAVLVERDGSVAGRYDKMCPVMFGEYVPLAKYWPWLYRLTPLADGLESGTAPRSLPVAGVRIAPNICFETLLPHFIRGQVADLSAAGAEPDVLVNLTNDGWFWGSSELDLHLMCGAIRAVECRKPLLIAANTGFSAVIDGDGRILAQGRRRDTDVLVHDVALDSRRSPYVRIGDWGAGFCLVVALAGGVLGTWRKRAGRTAIQPAG